MDGGREKDALEALEALGYSPLEASRALKEAQAGLTDAPVEDLIKGALRLLERK